mmetsp:Transcript_34315/g.58102  ORF Transcript_34315/g.58102 Transcript_34315/m.58102 type:complete len:233 (-) Transcript_34315:293-991(-)
MLRSPPAKSFHVSTIRPEVFNDPVSESFFLPVRAPETDPAPDEMNLPASDATPPKKPPASDPTPETTPRAFPRLMPPVMSFFAFSNISFGRFSMRFFNLSPSSPVRSGNGTALVNLAIPSEDIIFWAEDMPSLMFFVAVLVDSVTPVRALDMSLLSADIIFLETSLMALVDPAKESLKSLIAFPVTISETPFTTFWVLSETCMAFKLWLVMFLPIAVAACMLCLDESTSAPA